MKTTFFSILISLLCLANVGYSQSVTLTGFNGKIEFKSFVTNGANIRGTLINFIDQTNQYTAANIAVNDIAWDNQGRRYKVVAIVSTTSIQAVVDLSRVGGGTHFPRGLGFISRETENGLSLFTAANTLGMSTALLSRVLNHNMSRIDSVFKRASLLANIYNSNGEIPNLNRILSYNTTGNSNTITYTNSSSNTKSYDISFNFGSSANIYSLISNFFLNGNRTNSNIYNRATSNIGNTSESSLNLQTSRSPFTSGIYNTQSILTTKQGVRQAGLLSNIDSVGNSVQNFIYFTTNRNQKYHTVGFSNTNYTGNPGVLSSNPAYFIQTFFNSSTKFDWFKIDNIDNDTTSDVVSFYNKKYTFKNQKPTTTSGAISAHVWVAGDPTFIQSKNGLATGTTDGSGDLTITIPAMPDNTYSVLLTVNGTTNYQVSAHTLTTTTFKVRCSSGSAQSVSILYEVKDY